MKWSTEQIKDLEALDKDFLLPEDYIYNVNAIDIIKAWSEYEVDIPTGMTAEEFFEYVLKLLGTEDKEFDEFDNSYNWGANITHHFDYKGVWLDRWYFTLVKWHRYGDVRGNYTEYALYKTSREESLLWAAREAEYGTDLVIDGVKVNICPTISSEYTEIFIPREDLGDWDEVAGICCEDDVRQWLYDNGYLENN